MAIHRFKRDRYCAKRLEKHGRIANATSSLLFAPQKKIQNKHKKIIKKC